MKITHPYDKYPGPESYEDDPAQCDTSTATYWAVHYGVAEPSEALPSLAALDHPMLTGEYAAGDSWRTWGEEVGREYDNDAVHVCVYVHSAASLLEDVVRVIALQAYATAVTGSTFHVSTAGDFAEQLMRAHVDRLGVRIYKYARGTTREYSDD